MLDQIGLTNNYFKKMVKLQVHWLRKLDQTAQAITEVPSLL